MLFFLLETRSASAWGSAAPTWGGDMGEGERAIPLPPSRARRRPPRATPPAAVRRAPSDRRVRLRPALCGEGAGGSWADAAMPAVARPAWCLRTTPTPTQESLESFYSFIITTRSRLCPHRKIGGVACKILDPAAAWSTSLLEDATPQGLGMGARWGGRPRPLQLTGARVCPRRRAAPPSRDRVAATAVPRLPLSQPSVTGEPCLGSAPLFLCFSL